MWVDLMKESFEATYFVFGWVVAFKVQYLFCVRLLTVDLCVYIVPSSVLINNTSKKAS